MIRMTVYAGQDGSDEDGLYIPSTKVHLVPEHALSEELRKLGLEWKNSDYFPTRQTVIVLDPVPDEEQVDVRTQVREAAEALERTGLL